MVGYTGLKESSKKIMKRDEALITEALQSLSTFYCVLMTKKEYSI